LQFDGHIEMQAYPFAILPGAPYEQEEGLSDLLRRDYTCRF
jgi:hypothetical protein